MQDHLPNTLCDTKTSDLYHHGYILITLCRNRNACEICFTIEHQFCQKLHTDHQWSLFPGKYDQILFDLLTIRPWRDHGSDQNVSGTLVTDLFFCHSVFIGTSSSAFINTHLNPYYDFIIVCPSQLLHSQITKVKLCHSQPLYKQKTIELPIFKYIFYFSCETPVTYLIIVLLQTLCLLSTGPSSRVHLPRSQHQEVTTGNILFWSKWRTTQIIMPDTIKHRVYDDSYGILEQNICKDTDAYMANILLQSS